MIASLNAAKAAYRREFAEKFKAARKAKGLMQSEIADALGLAQTSIANWELGRNSPNEHHLKRLIAMGLFSADEIQALGEGKSGKPNTLTVRLADNVRAEMERVATSGPYPISLTAIVERGIVLAVAEIDEMNAHSRGRK
jgi:transcriptional regulator with XRE-family HTH domain